MGRWRGDARRRQQPRATMDLASMAPGTCLARTRGSAHVVSTLRLCHNVVDDLLILILASNSVWFWNDSHETFRQNWQTVRE